MDIKSESNGLIHTKIVLVQDHVKYKKRTRKSDCYRIFAMGHEKPFGNVCQWTFISKSGTIS